MAATQPIERSEGLICPSCSGVVPVVEGTRIVVCPYCGTHSLLQGDRGIQRWQVRRKIDRETAVGALEGFLGGVRKARDLRQTATISEVILAYLPFWRVDATVAGWLFGRVSSGDDDTKPAEYYIFEAMGWNDAALDVGDLAINHIAVKRADLVPFDSRQVHAEAMVFDPTESSTAALDEAQRYFLYEADRRSKQKTTYYRNVQLLSPTLTLVYYPVWIVRYAYKERVYQVAVDGVDGAIIAGNAPGSTAYRSAALVAALAAGTFMIVNGTILMLSSGLTDDDGLALILLPAVLGTLLIFWGYRSFRFGAEVEDRSRKYGKVGPDKASWLSGIDLAGQDWDEVVESGRAAINELRGQPPQDGDT